MALPDQPYLPLYVDDWSNNQKLKLVSMSANGWRASRKSLPRYLDGISRAKTPLSKKRTEDEGIFYAEGFETNCPNEGESATDMFKSSTRFLVAIDCTANMAKIPIHNLITEDPRPTGMKWVWIQKDSRYYRMKILICD